MFDLKTLFDSSVEVNLPGIVHNTPEAEWSSLSLKDKLTAMLQDSLDIGDLNCAETYRKRLEAL